MHLSRAFSQISHDALCASLILTIVHIAVVFFLCHRSIPFRRITSSSLFSSVSHPLVLAKTLSDRFCKVFAFYRRYQLCTFAVSSRAQFYSGEWRSEHLKEIHIERTVCLARCVGKKNLPMQFLGPSPKGRYDIASLFCTVSSLNLSGSNTSGFG